MSLQPGLRRPSRHDGVTTDPTITRCRASSPLTAMQGTSDGAGHRPAIDANALRLMCEHLPRLLCAPSDALRAARLLCIAQCGAGRVTQPRPRPRAAAFREEAERARSMPRTRAMAVTSSYGGAIVEFGGCHTRGRLVARPARHRLPAAYRHRLGRPRGDTGTTTARSGAPTLEREGMLDQTDSSHECRGSHRRPLRVRISEATWGIMRGFARNDCALSGIRQVRANSEYLS